MPLERSNPFREVVFVLDPRATARNFSVALFVQGFAFIVSAVTSFVVPKVLPLEPFGYWQLFLFYVGFLGFLQLGLSDGVYLRYGGQARSVIDARVVSQQFVFGLGMQIVVAISLAVAASYVADPNRRLVLLVLAGVSPIFNAKRYWGYVFQAMNETRLFSFSVLVASVGFMVPLMVLLLLRVVSFEPYVAAFAFSEGLALGYCLICARGVLSISALDWRQAMRESVISIRVGIKLLIATLAGVLILGVARFVIDAVWSVRTFGLVSVAVTMVTFFLTLMSQVSMVLYPGLRQSASADQSAVLVRLRFLGLVFLPVAYLLYFPARWGLGLWLPSYMHAFVLAALLMPIAVFDGLMQVVYTTYFKVARREQDLMVLNVATVAVSVAVVLMAGFGAHSIELVLLGPSVAAAVRALVADRIMLRSLGVDSHWEMAGNVAVGALFVVAVSFANSASASAAVMGAYAVLLVWRRREWAPILVGLSRALGKRV